MNYEQLLRKYMAHLYMGQNWISIPHLNHLFTEEEVAELRRISGEVIEQLDRREISKADRIADSTLAALYQI